ncbi:18386_t:CDS:2, partial [Dentiscutata erythropus]
MAFRKARPPNQTTYRSATNKELELEQINQELQEVLQSEVAINKSNEKYINELERKYTRCENEIQSLNKELEQLENASEEEKAEHRFKVISSQRSSPSLYNSEEEDIDMANLDLFIQIKQGLYRIEKHLRGGTPLNNPINIIEVRDTLQNHVNRLTLEHNNFQNNLALITTAYNNERTECHRWRGIAQQFERGMQMRINTLLLDKFVLNFKLRRCQRHGRELQQKYDMRGYLWHNVTLALEEQSKIRHLGAINELANNNALRNINANKFRGGALQIRNTVPADNNAIATPLTKQKGVATSSKSQNKVTTLEQNIRQILLDMLEKDIIIAESKAKNITKSKKIKSLKSMIKILEGKLSLAWKDVISIQNNASKKEAYSALFYKSEILSLKSKMAEVEHELASKVSEL